jgi:RHH-type proline utilization regulon transcriptional repressor/proline dehydrogenase/delta 1-pyrroline-5-carboxylate dehydrogenase
MDKDFNLEEKIRAIGRELYSAVSSTPPLFDTKSWMGRTMDWAMQNEDFRVRLFRFIDVLPSLKTSALVVRILHEYFSGETEVPRLVRGGLALIGRKGLLPQVAGPVIRKSVESIARQFIAGKDDKEAGRALEDLTADGTGFSIDILGEVVVSDKEAQEYARRYLRLLDFLHERSIGMAVPDVSIKISSFYSQLDPVDWEGSVKRVKEGLRPVLLKANELGISVTFDMEHFHYRGLIIAIFKGILDEAAYGGLPFMAVALQAYLKDTERDLVELIEWTRTRGSKIGVRLVKGAYWDYEVAVNRQKGWPVPVFLNKEETDVNFERLTRLLFENRDVVRPAVATHNLRSISHAMALADAMDMPADAFEFQMLYGMAEPLRKAVRGRGYDLRTYTPFGELIPGMAYLVRRLLENTSNTSFLRRSFAEKAAFEELIKAPAPPQPLPRGEGLHLSPSPLRGRGPGRGGSAEETHDEPFRNEPLLDFSIEANRKNMVDALRAAREAMNSKYPLVIGGREVWTEREILSQNPASPGEVVGRASSATKENADEAVSEALKARDGWRRTGPEKRAGYLFKAAAEMRKKRFELAALEVLEAGKTWKDADGDVCEAIDYLEYYGREMLRLGSPKILGDYPGEENEYRYVPKGLGVVISPWNFPLAIATGMTSAALVAGNCVIFKPSGLTPVTGYRLFEIFRHAGLPPGVLQFLPGPGSEVGEHLVSHPDIDFIAFTGSKEVGLRIVELAGRTGAGQRNVKKVVAEMGGKNAVVVDETADLDEAIKGIVESAFGYQGQKCSACSRVIAVGDIYNEFCERLKEAVSSLRIGPPEDPGNLMGPVIDAAALEKIKSYIELGKKEGRLLIERDISRHSRLSGSISLHYELKEDDSGQAGMTSKDNIDSHGYFIGPAVFVDTDPASRIATEEIFGPVLTVIRAKDFDDAIRLANDSLYALTGGLFSRSPANIQRAKEDFRAGNLYINRRVTGALVGRQPFGGFGMSGVGSKAGGHDYLLQFMNPVSISENTIRRGFAPLK